MKISLAWVFDHLDAYSKDFDMQELAARFGITTTEIEQIQHISTTHDQWQLASLQAINNKTCVMVNEYINLTVTVPARADVTIGSWYLINTQPHNMRFVSYVDLGSTKDGFLPAIMISRETIKEYVTTGWRHDIETRDVVWTLSTNSIGHRPDLWGHRGIAREIAAQWNISLKPLSALYQPTSYVYAEKTETLHNKSSFTISRETTEYCKRLAAGRCEIAFNNASNLFMLQRLARVDARARNLVVDATNYVMFDLGQPMHAFDATKLHGNALVVRMARPEEKLTLLDETEITLSHNDIVLADAEHAIGLAGIMGGLSTAVDNQSTHILIEAGTFDAPTIRRSAISYKKRTEASSRFERYLDPTMPPIALQRFITILRNAGAEVTVYEPFVALGQEPTAIIIHLTHAEVEHALGVSITGKEIIALLTTLEFNVMQEHDTYTIQVPSFRATKDIQTRADVIEEIARSFGYNNIPATFPLVNARPRYDRTVSTISKIKQYCAYACGMHEVANYALYPQSWINQLQYEPSHAVQVINPQSQEWLLLVTSLIPGLLKNVAINSDTTDNLRFFEWGRVWTATEKDNVNEYQKLAGIFYDAHQEIDFYQCKALIDNLYALLGVHISWKQIDIKTPAPWYAPYRSAQLFVKDRCVGIAGMLDNYFIKDVLTGSGFVFELDGEFLRNITVSPVQVVMPSKFPEVHRDISLAVPLTCTVAMIIQKIKAVHPYIVRVELKDFFEKNGSRSITCRYVIQSPDATLTKPEVDAISQSVERAVQTLGAEVR